MSESEYQIGDGVTCYNVLPLEGNKIAPPLKLKQGYIIKDIHVCSCGQDHFDVGLASIHNWVSCYKCGKQLPQSDSRHWCHPNRFNEELNKKTQ